MGRGGEKRSVGLSENIRILYLFNPAQRTLEAGGCGLRRVTEGGRRLVHGRVQE